MDGSESLRPVRKARASPSVMSDAMEEEASSSESSARASSSAHSSSPAAMSAASRWSSRSSPLAQRAMQSAFCKQEINSAPVVSYLPSRKMYIFQPGLSLTSLGP